MPNNDEALTEVLNYHIVASEQMPTTIHNHAKKALKSAHEAVVNLLKARPDPTSPQSIEALAQTLENMAQDAIQPTSKWPDPTYNFAYTVYALRAALSREVYLGAARELRRLVSGPA